MHKDISLISKDILYDINLLQILTDNHIVSSILTNILKNCYII